MEVEVIVPVVAVGPRIEAAEDLNPQQLFSLYSSQQGLSPGSEAAGTRILDTLTVAGASAMQRSTAVINFGSIELEGYLSFR